jgi:hypothetical protein
VAASAVAGKIIEPSQFLNTNQEDLVEA